MPDPDLGKKISILILEHLVITESNEAIKDYCGHVKKTQGTTEEAQYWPKMGKLSTKTITAMDISNS